MGQRHDGLDGLVVLRGGAADALPPRLLSWVHAALRRERVALVAPLPGSSRSVRLTTDTGRRLVLRRPGDASRAGAEAAVLAALAPEGPRPAPAAVPCPALLRADPAGELAGEPALLSEWVHATPLDRAAGRVGAAADGLGRALGAALAALHRARPPAPASPPSPPEPLTGRVERRLAAAGLAGDGAAAVRSYARALAPALDGGPAVLVHGDLRARRVLVAPQRGRWGVAALVGWDRAGPGAPARDLAALLRPGGDLPAGLGAAVGEGYREAGGDPAALDPRAVAALDLLALLQEDPAGAVRVARERGSSSPGPG
ncbi:phosphotransferase [Vallicoccus soli]|uniref:phosphotransferase n=1 Tax=Vallicoccus soli TaxID=2339232 RepID=UPI0014028DA5|nr:phosphotransferase [Vallicoccus soli]